ncbi:MAG: hypothetical protein Q8P41_22615 [Pseudomonadota bacterium]|nr:hypothetical protein [Pseudomonadota bacterium]
MIDWGRPALHRTGLGGGVTVLADHADPLLFHYLPDRPRLRRDEEGRPELRLVRYALAPELREVLGGGLLSLTVDLHVPDEALAPLRSALTRMFELPAPAKLVPVVPEGGTARLLLLDHASDDPAATRLVERMLGDARAGLYGGNPATFLAVLPDAGTAVVEACLRKAELPLGVVYALDVVGIRPALRVRIEIRWAEAYDFLEDRMKGGAILLAVDIGPTIEELVRREHVRVHIDQLLPDDARTRAWEQAVERIQAELVQHFLVPTLGEEPVPAGGDEDTDTLRQLGMGLLGAFSYTLSLRRVQRTEQKTMTYDLSIACAETRTLAPQATLSALLTPDEREEGPTWSVDDLIVVVEQAGSQELRFDVGTAVDLAALGVDRIELVLAYGDDEVREVLDAARPTVRWSAWYDAAVGLALRWRYTVSFVAAAEGGPMVVTSEERTGLDRVIRFDPRELVQLVDLRIVAAAPLFVRFPQVLVDVRLASAGVGAPVATTLTLDAAHGEARFAARLARGDAPVVEWRLRYLDTAGAVLERPWEQVEPGLALVPDPTPAIVDVQIVASARFGVEVARLLVEMRPRSRPDEVQGFVLDAAHGAATWSTRAAEGDPAGRGWSSRVTVHTVRGEVRTGEWVDGEGGRLLVGEGFERLRDVQLRILGRAPAELGLLGLKIRLAARGPDGALVAEFEDLLVATGNVAWAYPLVSAQHLEWSWQVTRIAADGTVDTLPPVVTQDKMAVFVVR